MSATTPTQSNPISLFNFLPDDPLYCIFSQLPRPQDIFSVLLTDRRFSAFVSNCQPLWGNLLQSHFPNSFKLLQNPKEDYQRLKNIDNNIRKTNFRTYFPGIHAVEKFSVEGNKICACLLDGTIKVWDTESGKELHTLNDIGNCSASPVLRGNVLCSKDGNDIIIWDLKTETKRHILKAHRDRIHSLVIQKNELISRSSDSVRIWDLESGEEMKAWKGDFNISSHAVQGDTLFIVFDNDLKAFDIKSGKELYTLPGHSDQIYRLYVQGTTLVSCDSGCQIKIWDLESRKERHAWKLQYNYANPQLTVIGDVLFVGGADKNEQSIYALDLKSGKQLPSVPCTWDTFGGIASHGGLLYTSQSRAIEVYDFNFPSLSSYSKQALEENLSLLVEMTTADLEHAKTLAKKLHPDFQERLRQHAFKCSRSFEPTEEVISRVQTEVIIEFLLDRIHGQDQKRVSELLDQLAGVNNTHTQLLYNELGQKSDGTGDCEFWGKCAFQGDFGYLTSIEQKEHAVLTLKKILTYQWGPDLPLLLVDLGVVSKGEYSQKLQCRPEDLKKVGILSLADLQALGILNAPPIARLVAPKETPDQPKHMQLGEKRTRVVDALETLSELVQKRYQESENLGVTLFTDAKGSPIGQELNPWAVFQKQFNQDKALLEEICESPKKLSEDKGTLLEKANALIDQFNTLNCEYQLVKLGAYIRQQGIQPKWAALNAQNITSLAEFAQKNPDSHLFMMGN